MLTWISDVVHSRASSSTAIEEPAKVSRPKRRTKTLCSEVIRKVCSKKPGAVKKFTKFAARTPWGLRKSAPKYVAKFAARSHWGLRHAAPKCLGKYAASS